MYVNDIKFYDFEYSCNELRTSWSYKNGSRQAFMYVCFYNELFFSKLERGFAVSIEIIDDAGRSRGIQNAKFDIQGKIIPINEPYNKEEGIKYTIDKKFLPYVYSAIEFYKTINGDIFTRGDYNEDEIEMKISDDN